MAKTTVYLKLKPRWRGERFVGFVIDGATQNRPHRATGPVVKLTLDLPASIFMPEVSVEVSADALDYEPMVRVEEPDGGEPWEDVTDAG